MLTSITSFASQFFTALPFTGATWFTLSTLIFFVWLFGKASKNPLTPLKWEHLIIDSNDNRASPYKLCYLIGVIVSTWIVIRFADKQTLNFDILGMYLTYLVTGAGVNSFVSSRQPSQNKIETTVVQTSTDALP
ncbi:MAG: hypothetical protein Q7T55_06715 [Solirubrobacteraceae bacterium]|nr:hypothetical protein [Solirubrobacteraceae bacterium]